MAGLNKFWGYNTIKPNMFQFLFHAPDKSSRQDYEFTIQDALRDSMIAEELIQQKGSIKKTIKRMPVVKEHENVKKGKNQPTRGKQEIERKQESARLENSDIHGKEEGMLQEIKAGHLPLREAVILSEIIGAPRCKNRFKRRG